MIPIWMICIHLFVVCFGKKKCSHTHPEWVAPSDKPIKACFEYDKGTKTPIEFSIILDVATYINDANSNFPTTLSDGKWDLIDAASGDVAYECCGHETILNIPRIAKKLTTLKQFIINFFLDALLPPHEEQKRYAMHYYFIDENYRQNIIKAGTTDNICDKDEYFFNVPCDIWDKCQIYPSNENVIPPNYINKNAILPGMGNHFVNPSFSIHSDMTLVMGNYDGILNFFVPSISINFLKQFIERSEEVKGYTECYPLQLNENQVFSFEGYYPTQLCYKWMKKNVQIAFNNYQYFYCA